MKKVKELLALLNDLQKRARKLLAESKKFPHLEIESVFSQFLDDVKTILSDLRSSRARKDGLFDIAILATVVAFAITVIGSAIKRLRSSSDRQAVKSFSKVIELYNISLKKQEERMAQAFNISQEWYDVEPQNHVQLLAFEFRVAKYLNAEGGFAGAARRNHRKAGKLMRKELGYSGHTLLFLNKFAERMDSLMKSFLETAMSKEGPDMSLLKSYEKTLELYADEINKLHESLKFLASDDMQDFVAVLSVTLETLEEIEEKLR